MSITERLAITPELRDTSTWDAPSEQHLEASKLTEYRKRKKAVIAYLEGASFAQIRLDLGYSKSQVYRMLTRCLTLRANGQMLGFFGLIPSFTVASYTRRAVAGTETVSPSRGLAGAFMQLMEEHEALRTYVERQASKSRGKTASAVARMIHTAFLIKCAKLRAPNQYPFNTGDRGIRALARYIERLRINRYLDAVSGEETPELIRDTKPLTAQPSGAHLLRPFEEVEHDGHNGDFYFVIKTLGFHGEWIYTAPLRMWLLLPLDRGSKAILGYSYRLGSTNYPAIAVVRSFVHALTPWKPKEITLPGLFYKEGAGFPSGVVPSAAGRLMDMICFDNGKGNIAKSTRQLLTREMGATLNYGRAGTPTARPFVERLNQTLETLGFRRLPVGFNPSGPKAERERAFKTACEYAITSDELEQIIDVMLANANADPHPALVNRSPNDFIRMWDSQTTHPLRRVEDPVAFARKLLRFEHISCIRGGGESHRGRYVEAWGARYTNDVLRKMTDATGKKVRLIADIDDDMRLIRGYIKGENKEIPIGILKALPPWHLTPHTLEQRKIILRAHRASKINVSPGTDMVQAFRHIKQREAVTQKSAAAELVKIGHIGSVAPPKKRDANVRVSRENWIKIK